MSLVKLNHQPHHFSKTNANSLPLDTPTNENNNHNNNIQMPQMPTNPHSQFMPRSLAVAPNPSGTNPMSDLSAAYAAVAAAAFGHHHPHPHPHPHPHHHHHHHQPSPADNPAALAMFSQFQNTTNTTNNNTTTTIGTRDG